MMKLRLGDVRPRPRTRWKSKRQPLDAVRELVTLEGDALA